MLGTLHIYMWVFISDASFQNRTAIVRKPFDRIEALPLPYGRGSDKMQTA